VRAPKSLINYVQYAFEELLNHGLQSVPELAISEGIKQDSYKRMAYYEYTYRVQSAETLGGANGMDKAMAFLTQAFLNPYIAIKWHKDHAKGYIFKSAPKSLDKKEKLINQAVIKEFAGRAKKIEEAFADELRMVESASGIRRFEGNAFACNLLNNFLPNMQKKALKLVPLAKQDAIERQKKDAEYEAIWLQNAKRKKLEAKQGSVEMQQIVTAAQGQVAGETPTAQNKRQCKPTIKERLFNR